ncbi:MAG: fibronectin type III domain-containing protein [Myxococcota bacterium]
MRSLWILILAGCLAACTDSTPPSWGSGELEVVEVGSTTARVRWSEATDDDAIELYRVRNEGAVVAELGPSVTQVEIGDLEDATEIRVSVEALDRAGNASEPLYVELTTTDGTPPAWPSGAALRATTAEETLTLTWPSAEDNNAVTSYRLMRGGEVIAEPEAGATTFETTGGWEGVHLVAFDEAGNRSPSLRAIIAGVEPVVEAAPTAAPVAQPVRIPLSPSIQRSLGAAIMRMPADRPLQIPQGVASMALERR